MNRSLIPLLYELEKVKYHKALMCVEKKQEQNRTEQKNKEWKHWVKYRRIRRSILSFFNDAESEGGEAENLYVYFFESKHYNALQTAALKMPMANIIPQQWMAQYYEKLVCF